MFEWTPEKIRFLQEASDYTPFNRTLAERAMTVFDSSDHVLDAGCGIGYLSLELSRFCSRVTAADRSGEGDHQVICPEGASGGELK